MVLVDKVQKWLMHGGKKFWLEGFIASSTLLLIRIPEVFFWGGSLRLTDLQTAAASGAQPLTGWASLFMRLGLLPENLQWWSARSDGGGSVWQSDPAMSFVADSLKRGDSPYWNPLLGNGALGPESAVDLKFSVVSLLSIALGNSSTSFTVVMLLLMALSTTCLYVLLRRFLTLGPLAGASGIVAFSMNGYATSTLGANYAQNYWFLPILLLALINVLRHPSPMTILVGSSAFASILSSTFLPTLIVGLLSVFGILFASLTLRDQSTKRHFSLSRAGVVSMAASLGLGTLAVAPIYLPMFASFPWTGMLDGYGAREFFASIHFPAALPSIFSPSLFLESYQALTLERDGLDLLGGTVFHLGIVFSLLAAAGVNQEKTSGRFSWVLLGFMTFVIFRLAVQGPMKLFISEVPILGTIGSQYWWPALMLPFSILVAIGVSRALGGHPNILLTGTILFVAGLGVSWHLVVRGILEPNISTKQLSILLFVFTGLFVFVALLLLKRMSLGARCAAIAGVFLLGSMNLLIDSKLMFPAGAPAYSSEGQNQSVVFGEPVRLVTIGSDLNVYPASFVYQRVRDVSLLGEGGSQSYAKFYHDAFKVDRSYSWHYLEERGHGYFPTLQNAGNDSSKYEFDFRLINILGVNVFLVPSSFVDVIDYLSANGLGIVDRGDSWTMLTNPNAFPSIFGVDAGKYFQSTLGVELNVASPTEVKKAMTRPRTNIYSQAEITLTSRSLIVFTDNFAPGWTGFVNGKEVEVKKVQGVFMGVYADAGEALIEFKYSPPFLGTSFSLLGIALLSMLYLLVMGSYLKYRSRTPKP